MANNKENIVNIKIFPRITADMAMSAVWSYFNPLMNFLIWAGYVFRSFINSLMTFFETSDMTSFEIYKLKRILASLAKEIEREETEEKIANAMLLKAIQRSNLSSFSNRLDMIASMEKETIIAENTKIIAEAEAIRMDAESRRLKVVFESRVRLIEAISHLRQEGGELIIDADSIQKLLQVDVQQNEIQDTSTERKIEDK